MVTADPRLGTYRRWVLATTVGELAAFSVPTSVWALTSLAGFSDQAAYLPVVIAGAGEGAVLGFAQTRALRHDLPALDRRAWVCATAAAGALGWAVGLAPSTLNHALSGLPPVVLAGLGAGGAIVLLGAIGAAQALVLRRHVHHAARWVAANALGWLAGLPVVFLAFAIAPGEPASARAAFAVAGGVGMGFTVAVVTGRALVRLLGTPRQAPPPTLRRRAAVHFNHAHAWTYARTRGRLGGRIGGHPVLLLTTRGRRTGITRRTPLQYERIDGDLMLVAAAGGSPEPPAWWHNLAADPLVNVQIGADLRSARAITVDGDERRALWPRLCERNPQLERVQRRAGRELALVRLVVSTLDSPASPRRRSARARPSSARRSTPTPQAAETGSPPQSARGGDPKRS